MKNEEKIYQKIKNASNKNEEISFPGMDKVWNRVEEKLDKKFSNLKVRIFFQFFKKSHFVQIFRMFFHNIFVKCPFRSSDNKIPPRSRKVSINLSI